MTDWTHLLLIEPISILAYLVFGMVGFGSTLVSAPVLAHLLPVSTVVPAMAIGLYLGHRINLRMNRQRFMKVLYSVLLLTGSSLILRSVIGA